MSVLKRLGLLLLLMLLMLIAVIAYVTMTHGGMQRLFSLGKSYVAGELTIGQTTGALIGPATLSDVQLIDDNGLSVAIDHVSFDWRPGKLLKRTLQVDEFIVDGVTLRLPAPTESEPSSQPIQLRDFALPLSADVQNIRITDVQIYPHGASEPFVLNEIKLDATGRDSALKLVQLVIDGPIFSLAMDGTLDTRNAWPINLNQQWTYTDKTLGVVEGAGSLTGDTQSLHALHQVTGPASVDLDMKLQDVTGEISWDGKLNVSVDDLGTIAEGASGVPVSVEASGRGTLSDYELNGRLDSAHSSVGSTSTDFSVKGDLEELTITESITTLENSPVRLSVDGKTSFEDLQSDLVIAWTDLQWPLQTIDQPPVVIVPVGKFNVSGKPDRLTVTGSAEVSSTQSGPLDLMVDTAVTPQVITINTLRASPRLAADNAALNVNGEVDISTQALNLAGQLNQLTWPLIADGTPPVLSISSGDFSVTGSFDKYQLNLNTTIDGKNIPSGTWSVTALGGQSGLDPLTITGDTLQGRVSGDGVVSWQPQTQWRFNLETSGINPAEQWPGATGNIDLQVSTQGSLVEAGLAAENRIISIGGTYRDQPLSGNGSITVKGNTATIDSLNMNIGDATLSANGAVSDQLDLSWDISLPALQKLVPDVGGNVSLKGNVSGPLESPDADFTLNASNIETGGLTIQSARGNVKVDLSGNAKSSVKLTMKEVASGGQTFSDVTFDGSGTPAQHKANLTIAGDVLDVKLDAEGGVADGIWKGTLESLDLKNAQAGQWALTNPVNIEAGAKQVTANDLCLQSSPSEVCIDGKWDSSNGVEARVELDSLDTKRFGDYMPPELTIEALVNGSADIAVAPGESPVVSADIRIPGGTMDYLDGGEPKSTTLGNSRVQFDFRDDNLNSKVNLDLGDDIGTVDATTSITQLSGARNLGGQVKTDIKDISPFSAFAPGLDSFDGALNTNMKLAGSLDQPRVAGGSELDALVLEVPSVAMKVVDGKIIARSDGKGGLLLSGKARSGDGMIELQGSYDPAAKKLDATIKGENFRVANADRQRAEISPDIRVKMDGDDINISGLLHIPSAFIDTGASSGLVKESSDVVMVNGDTEEEDAAGSRVTVDVRVTLGDDIRVKAGQFSGALAGELAVEQVPDGVPTGVGAIEVVSGDFLVYGQKLTMERGQILFGGGPITNPALEFDVAREVAAYDVKAGALIRGTAQAPILQLQSEPAQTDANTLSFILLGTPVDTAGVSYTFGKYITPDIYVSYERDLFTKVQTFSVRYRISDRLTLLASSSEDVSGSDLVYTWER